jgi:transcriptional regulator PpsR
LRRTIAVKLFDAPAEILKDLDAEAAGALIAAATDIALVVGTDGVIKDMSIGGTDLADEPFDEWVGRRWADTVTDDTRAKIELLLAEAPTRGPSTWRQVNHPGRAGKDVPILYATVRLGGGDQILAVGRNLGAIATLQQRLVEAQQTLERDYSRIRMAETRYRLLFQTTAEAVMILDANTEKVLEANPATRELLGDAGGGIVGKSLTEVFDTAGRKAIDALLAGVRAAGRAADVRVQTADGGREFLVGASMFRQGSSSCFLVRMTPAPRGTAGESLQAEARFLKMVENAPEAFVVTDDQGRVLAVNPAFLELAQLAHDDQAHGRPLEDWLGRPGVDMNVLMSHLRQHGAVRFFETSLRAELGPPLDVELSAVAVAHGTAPCYGFMIRNVVRPSSTATTASGRELPRSVEQLTELVGRVPLKELVRETTDVIERLCIEAALELTEDNRASAAEMLGLSRQSLYVKLRRYGLGDLTGEGEGEVGDS